MVRIRGGSRLRPRVRFSTPEREALAPVPAPVPVPVPKAVLLPTGGAAVLSLDDISRSSWPARASVLYR